MKKLISSVAIAAAVLATMSCTKDGGTFGNGSVKATIAEDYLDGANALTWGNGSSFSLFTSEKANAKFILASGADSKNGQFESAAEGTGTTIASGIVAVSPFYSGATVTMSGGVANIKTIVPSTVNFTKAGSYDAGTCPLVAVVDANKASKLSFVAPLGGISVKLTGSQTVSKVEITAKGGEILNGTLNVTASEEGVSSAMLTGGSSTTEIECGAGIPLTQVAKDFVIFVPAGTYEDGFSIKVKTTEGDINIIDVAGPCEVTKARILNITRQQFVTYTDINEGSDERANCYVVTSGGGYYFDATVKGNGDAGLHPTFKEKSTKLSPEGAKLVWEEKKGLVTGVTYENGKIYFACSGKDGNAVIAATDGAGNTIWSWHIWSTGKIKDLHLGEWDFMDRNLGAKSAEHAGVYYQWGRKDPFSAILGFDSGMGEGNYHPVEGGATDNETVKNTVEYSVAHPETFLAKSSRNNDWLLEAPQRYLWGVNYEADGLVSHSSIKTIYDPCPIGYSVSTAAALNAGKSAGAAQQETSITLFNGLLKIAAGGFIYNGGFGWYDQEHYAGLWSCSTSWGNYENAFRLNGISDAFDHYDRAVGLPVRCVRFSK